MELTINDIVKIFAVGERTVNGWIEKKKMPCIKANEQYRFNYIELLDWALEKKIKEAPVSAEDVKATEKVIKKTAVVHFFKLKYPGIGENVAEELADAIVNKAGSAAIKKIAEKYKAHLDALTAVGAKNETVSSSGICGGLKKEIQESCVERVNFIIEQSRKVLSNEIPFRNYWREIDNTAFDAFGRTVYVSPGDDLLAPVKEARTRIIKAAYENWFGKPIRDIEAELASIKEEFSRQSSRPATGRRGNPPDFSYKNTFFSKDYKDDSLYQGFESGTAQKSYEIFVKDATAMQTANKAVLRFEKVELARMNSLLQSLSRLEARIASIDSSFDSAPGILSFGSGDDRFKDATHDAHNRYTVKWREEITLMKDGKRWLWSYWRTDSWRTDYGINRIIKNLKETILDLENNLANEAELLVSIKKEYTDALERYPKIKKQKDEETAKVVEALEEKFAERDRALAEEKAAEEKKTAEEKSWLQKMLERVKNFTAEKEAKKEAAKQKELEEQQKLEKQGIKTFDVSTEEGRKGYGKSLEEEKEKILEEELEKKQKEEDATKKLLEETRKQTEAEQKRLEETKPQQTGGALSGTLNLPDNFNVEYFSNYPDSALFTKEGALLVNPRSESSKYYATTDFSWSDAYGLMSGSDVSDVGINGTPSENELTRGILELGPGKLESLNSVPDSGYKSFTEYSAWSHYYYDKEYIYPKAGYLYGIKTHDGKYAAIEVISVSKTQLQIKWKYQPNGSNKF